jgi:hypothetical protein
VTSAKGTNWICKKCQRIISHSEFELFDGFCRPCVLSGGNLYSSSSDIKRSIRNLEDEL